MKAELWQRDFQPELPLRTIGSLLEWAGRHIVLLKAKDFAPEVPTSFSFILRSIASAPGWLLRRLAGCDKPLFQIDRPEGNKAQNPTSSLKVLSLNSACLPSWITVTFNNLRPTPVRAQEIAHTILQHADEYDV